MAPLALPGDALKGSIVSARGVNREMVAVKRRSEQEQSDGGAANGQRTRWMARMSLFGNRPLRNEVWKLEEVDISVSNAPKTSKEAVLNIREVLDQWSLWWLPNPKTMKRIAVNPCDESPTQQPCTWDSSRSTAGLIRQLPANASLVIPRLRFHSASGDPQRDTSGSGSAIRRTKRYGATAASLMDRGGSGGGEGDRETR